MGFFSKIFKSFKKGVKKIGRGIKKVMGKVGKAFGKLGIVGQIGLMFLMPHMMAGLGTFWQGFGSFASKLAGPESSVISKIFGKTLSAVHTAGSMVGKVYTGVTDTINSAIDVVTGKGTLGDLKTSVKSIFTGPVDTFKASFAPNTLGGATPVPTIQDTIDVISKPSPSIADSFNNATNFDSGSILAPPVVTPVVPPVVPSVTSQKNMLSKIVDYGRDTLDTVKTNIKEYDLGETISTNLTSGIDEGIKQQGYEAIVGKRPDPTYNSTTIDIGGMYNVANQSNIVDQVDLTMQKEIGNPYIVNSMINYDHLQSGLIQDETSWFHSKQQASNLINNIGY